MQASTVSARVKEIICEVRNLSALEAPLEVGALGDDDLLFDVEATGSPNLGLDSLDAVEIWARFEEEFSVRIPDQVDPYDLSTVRRLAGLIDRLRRHQS